MYVAEMGAGAVTTVAPSLPNGLHQHGILHHQAHSCFSLLEECGAFVRKDGAETGCLLQILFQTLFSFLPSS